MQTAGTTLKTSPRPALLTSLCVLALAGVAISSFTYVSSYFSYKAMNALNASSFLIMLIFEQIILTGILFVWCLKKTGFYIYIIGQIASFVYPFASGTEMMEPPVFLYNPLYGSKSAGTPHTFKRNEDNTAFVTIMGTR